MRQNEDSSDFSIMNLDAHKMAVLLYLYRNPGPRKKTEVYENVSKSPGMVSKVDELTEMGILEQSKVAYKNTTYVELTDKGRKMARTLAVLEDQLKGKDVEAIEDDYVSAPGAVLPGIERED